MRRVFSWSAALLLTIGVGACGGAAVQPANVPPEPVDPQTRLEPKTKETEELPRLIAPPPAYGNKIVMAQGAPMTNSF